MKEFKDILKAFRRLTFFAIALASILTVSLLFKFDVLILPNFESKKSYDGLTIAKTIEKFPGELGSVDEESGLIIDYGFNIVKTQCGSCHSTKLVAQNRFSRDGWLELIRWMQESQNLWDLGDQENIILDYLEKNFAPQSIGRRKPLVIKEWYVLKE